MMSYRYDKHKKVQRRWYFAGSIFMLLILFTPVYRLIFGATENPVIQTYENRQAALQKSTHFLDTFSIKQDILTENKKLKEENKRLAIDNLRTDYVSQELEKIYGFKKSEADFVPANILHYGTFGQGDTALINQGLSAGISVGDSVLGFDHILLGSVSEVYAETARIIFHSRTNQVIQGVLFPHDIQLEARGNGGGDFIIETPREIEVVSGDIFYALSEPGYIIGIVRDVVFDSRDPFKKVYLSYPENLNTIHEVAIKKTLIHINE